MSNVIAPHLSRHDVSSLTCPCLSVSRTIHFGSIRKLQVDDWLMLCTLAFYTTLIVTINIVADADTNLFPAGFDVGDLTAADKSRREFGSKLVLVVEQSQIMTVYADPACITTYSRTDGL